MSLKGQAMIDKYPIDWSKDKIKKFRRVLLDWYDKEKRDLPWRQTKDPYKIWVSEIMLQQTQVDTVIPYYKRFIKELPNVQSLASADEELLLSLWQGLGYYSRVRNMKEAAIQIEKEFEGIIPSTYEELVTLKGIGPYTAGAISSMAFDLPEPAVDGNLLRVVTRLFELNDDITLVRTRRKITSILYQLIDPNRPGDFNQALMDLGATIMTPSNTHPVDSPIKEFDASFKNGTSHLYPVKKQKIPATEHNILAYVIENQDGEWLLRKHQKGELLKGLWHFPMIEQSLVMEESTSFDEIISPLEENEKIDLKEVMGEESILSFNTNYILEEGYEKRQFPIVKHVFSHRIWYVTLIPLKVVLNDEIKSASNWQFISPINLSNIPLSTLQE